MSVSSICSSILSLQITPGNLPRSRSKEILIFSKAVQSLASADFWSHAAQQMRVKSKASIIYLEGRSVGYSRAIFESLLALGIALPVDRTAFLISKLINVNFDFFDVESQALSSLHKATIAGRLDLVQEALSTQSASLTDKMGRTALQWALFLGHMEIARALVSQVPVPNSNQIISGFGLYQAMAGLPVTIPERAPREKYELSAFQLSVISGHVEKIDRNIAEVATALFSIKKNVTQRSKEDLALLIGKSNHPQLFLDYLRYETSLRNVCHMWQVDFDNEEICYVGGNYPISFIPQGGGVGSYYMYKMANNCIAFQSLFAHDPSYNLPVLGPLQKALFGGAFSYSLRPDELLEKYWQDDCLLMPLNFPYHIVAVLIIGSHFIICNGGQEGLSPIEIYRFDKASLGIDTMKMLCSPINSVQAYRSLIFVDLPAALKFCKFTNERILEETLAAPRQKVGNCSWHNSEIAVYVFFMMHMMRDANLFRSNRTLNTEYVERLVQRRTPVFLNWVLFQQLKSLQKFLENQNGDFISTNRVLPHIVDQFRTIKNKSWVHSILRNKIYEMRARFAVLQHIN